MRYQAIFFDLDGTLLPMDQDAFVKTYFKLLCRKAAPLGYEPEKLVKALWVGTEAMVRNDGNVLNHDVFWKTFDAFYGEEKSRDEWMFDEFYGKEFHGAKEDCGYEPLAGETVRKLKAAGVPVVLATNPIFPEVATRSRIGWAGLQPEDFLYVSHYGNSRYSKPNPAYYAEILQKLSLKADEVLMVGNDAVEDLAAAKLGMDVFLLTDCLLNKDGRDLTDIPHGSFPELQRFLEI